MSRIAQVLVLYPDWRARLLEWLPSLGIRAELIQLSDVLEDEAKRKAAGSSLSDSWWDGSVLHLAYNPTYGPIEWLYVAAHFGLAEMPRKMEVDFGLLGLDPAPQAKAELKARELTIGWAGQAGARAGNLWLLTKEWEMTKIAAVAESPERFNAAIALHLQQTDILTFKLLDQVKTWTKHQPPKLYELREAY